MSSLTPFTRTAIQQALVQGLEVTVHQSPINVNGWQGSGYSVLDPETGVGAYQISGGASGGNLSDDILVGVSALLGLVDGNLTRISQAKPIWFSETLKNLNRLSKYSMIASYLGLAVSMINLYKSDATGASFYGQLALAIFGFLATIILVAKLMTEFSSRYF
jgi:hypothetical protein